MTTLAYLQAGGSRRGFTIAVEGYEYILVDGSNVANVATDIFTAGGGWAGTDWTQGLAGLAWNPTITRTLTPWSNKFDVPTARFVMQGGLHSDQFGIDTHKRGAGNQTELAVALDADDTTVTVQDTGDFASSGYIYVGGEKIKYTGKTAGTGAGDATFTGCTRGYHHPFATKSGTANRFGRAHDLPSVDWDVAYRPRVTDEPRTWVGRMVGVWCHAIRDGVWDTVANARLVFAGIITGIADTPDGNTVVALEDIAAKLRSTVLFKQQFRGRILEGLRIHTFGVDVDCAYAKMKAFTSTGTFTETETAADLTVTTGAPAGVTEIQEGYYDADELCGHITEWLANDGSIEGTWTLEIQATTEGDRAVLTCDMAADGSASGWNFGRLAIPYQWADFLGFANYDTETFFVGYVAALLKLPAFTGDGTGQLTAQNPPARVWIDLREQVDLDASQGTWINEPTWLPQTWQDSFVGSSEEWGVLQVGQEVFCLARRISDTSFEVREAKEITRHFGGKSFKDVNYRIGTAEGGRIEVRQIIVLQGSFKDLIARLFYSTGVANYNATTYDDWPETLGAGIPGSLLGATFEASLDVLDDGSVQDALTIVLSGATKLEDAIGADLMLRAAYLTWDAGLVWATLSPIVSGLAVHTFTEATKRSADVEDPQKVPTVTDRAHVRNIVNVDYNRDLTKGNYDSHLNVIDVASAQAYGERPVRIEARNSYGGYAGNGETVEAVTAELTGAVLPHFRQPISMLDPLTISPAFYQGVKVGDIASITDSHARDPSTGIRSISGKPGRILQHKHCFGGHGKKMLGEVAIAITAVEDEAIYSPCGYVASYSDPNLTLEAHAHTTSSEAVDASFFSDADEVIVIERDPAVAASAQSWQVAVSGTPSGNVVNVGTLSGYDAGKKYMIVPANYTTAVAAQRNTAFLADDADLQIQDSRQPYIWGGLYNGGAYTSGDGTTLPERHADEWFSDGFPVNPGGHAAAAAFIDNFVNYKGTIHVPWMYEGGYRLAAHVGATAGSWRHMETRPLAIGVGYVQGQGPRKWNVAPLIAASTANSVSFRVTFSIVPPIGGSEDVTFFAPYRQLTFTTSSTTFGVATTQTVEPVVVPETGRGWVTLEALPNTGGGTTADAHIWGFSKFYLGAFNA